MVDLGSVAKWVEDDDAMRMDESGLETELGLAEPDALEIRVQKMEMEQIWLVRLGKNIGEAVFPRPEVDMEAFFHDLVHCWA